MYASMTRHGCVPRVSGRRILLAEDDEAMIGFVAEYLERDGYQVLQIKDGAALDEWLRQISSGNDEDRVDVIVSDIHMPGKTALEVLGAYRRVVERVPVILVTAFGSEETHEEARALGARAILDKPFDLDELRVLLTEIVGEPDCQRC